MKFTLDFFHTKVIIAFKNIVRPAILVGPNFPYFVDQS